MKQDAVKIEGELLVNKSELVDTIATKADISKSAASRALDAFIHTVTHTLAEGNQVSLVGFGSFFTKQRPKREGRNPKTGEPLQIEAAVVPGFKAGKSLKDVVNKAIG